MTGISEDADCVIYPPHHCYSVHKDSSAVRFHFAIKTNPSAFFIYPSEVPFHIPADGYIYKIKSNELHSAMNGGAENRLHIVMEIGDKR